MGSISTFIIFVLPTLKITRLIVRILATSHTEMNLEDNNDYYFAYEGS
jgi:hypothetical protein